MNFSIYYFTLVFTVSSSAVFAQSFKYTSPESAEFKPVEVKTNDALNQAQTLGEICGYTKAYFSKDELQALLKLSGCVGLRIYNAKESDKQTNCDVIAVAINSSGKEIGPVFGNKYLHAKSYDENTSCTSKKLSQSKARDFVIKVANSQLEYQKVFFSKDLIDKRLNTEGSAGVAIIPGKNGSQTTILTTGANLVKGKISEVEAKYYKSQLPCPTHCGDTSQYLVSPN